MLGIINNPRTPDSAYLPNASSIQRICSNPNINQTAEAYECDFILNSNYDPLYTTITNADDYIDHVNLLQANDEFWSYYWNKEKEFIIANGAQVGALDQRTYTWQTGGSGISVPIEEEDTTTYNTPSIGNMECRQCTCGPNKYIYGNGILGSAASMCQQGVMVGPLNPKSINIAACDESTTGSCVKSGDLIRTIYGGESLCNPFGDSPIPCSDGPIPNILF